MLINELLTEKNMTKYRLAEKSGVPYTTVSDICNGKVRIEKCSAETLYRITTALDITMESVIESCLEERIDFELFKSNVCHMLKEKGDIQFIIDLLEEDTSREYYNKKWYPECLYLLAMLDYVSRLNDIPVCSQYNELRHMKLKKTIYPTSVLVASRIAQNDNLKRQVIKDSIPEFIKYNIVENEVRNVI